MTRGIYQRSNGWLIASSSLFWKNVAMNKQGYESFESVFKQRYDELLM
jgi:hypothetical protein